MKICLMGAGKMGSWFANQLSAGHELFVYDSDRGRCENLKRVTILDEVGDIRGIAPEMLINCVSLQKTVECFRAVLPFLPPDSLLCDIASVKTDLPAFYRQSGRGFVSIHPMFGPTFADLLALQQENVVLISDSDVRGKEFFQNLFLHLGLNIYEFSFAEHDVMMAYSLTLPFVASLVFSSCVSSSAVPGTTFRKHLDVAKGLLSEDEFLLAEIIFNPHSLPQLEKINSKLNFLWHIIRNRDTEEALKFFRHLRANLGIKGEAEP